METNTNMLSLPYRWVAKMWSLVSGPADSESRADFLEREEKECREAAREWNRTASFYDAETERITNEMIAAKQDSSFDFTVHSYDIYMLRIEAQEQMAWIAREKGVSLYKLSTKYRKKREKLIHKLNAARHAKN